MGEERDPSLGRQLSSHGINYMCAGIRESDAGFLKKICERLRTELISSHYDIVHIHTGWVRCLSVLCRAAKQAGAEIVIAHSHSNMPVKSNIKQYARKYYQHMIASNADFILACSRDAGCGTFGKTEWSKRGIFIENGIDLDKFKFDFKERRRVRGSNGGDFIIGQVGRLTEQKNYPFTIKVFSELHQIEPRSQLWVIGDGEMMEEIKCLVSDCGLTESVRFIGSTDNPAPYYQAMDAFIMPSKSEGLGIALLEAQACGLPCVISNRIPHEAILDKSKVVQLSLTDNPRKWAETLAALKCGSELNRDANKLVEVFSATSAAKHLETVYGMALALQ